MPAYAVQRFFFHASLHVMPAAFIGAGFFLLDRHYVAASVGAGIGAAAAIYRSAFKTSRDREK